MLIELLEQIKTWASGNSNVEGVLLVGSQAKGEARPDSDIDVVIICKNPSELLNNLSWINQFGTVDKHTLEDWGQVQSVRVFYHDAAEVEFGITSPAWAVLPIDPGTVKVLAGGAEIIVDKTDQLKKLLEIFENNNKISFRPLEQADLPLLRSWLCSDHVFQWYKDTSTKPTLAEVEHKYLPRILGQSKTSNYIIMVGAQPIGQIQMYKISDYPEYQQAIRIDGEAAGVDLFIGDLNYVHKGLGSTIIKRFLKDYVFTQLGVDACIIGPNPNNTAAIKAYEKAGLTYLKTIFDGDDDAYLMRISNTDTMYSS